MQRFFLASSKKSKFNPTLAQQVHSSQFATNDLEPSFKAEAITHIGRKGKGEAMLVLTRKADQKIIIGEEIEITIVRVRGNAVRLGINAPREVSVVRGELDRKIRAASSTSGELKKNRPLPVTQQGDASLQSEPPPRRNTAMETASTGIDPPLRPPSKEHRKDQSKVRSRCDQSTSVRWQQNRLAASASAENAGKHMTASEIADSKIPRQLIAHRTTRSLSNLSVNRGPLSDYLQNL